MTLHSINRPNTAIEIFYETIGNSDNKPLLFLHGLGAGRAQTTSALTELADTFLIAPDMLGHGDSLSEDDSALQSFDQFADDCIAILDTLGIKKVDLGGLSMGSGISLNIALRYPEYVDKLILLRPSWLAGKKPNHLALVAFVGQWIIKYGSDQAQQLLHENEKFIDLKERVPKVAASIDGLFTRPHHHSHTAVLYKMWQDAPFQQLDQLNQISNKTLILHTTRDDLHPIAVAESIANNLTDVQSHSLPPRYDDPHNYAIDLNKHLVDFLLD